MCWDNDRQQSSDSQKFPASNYISTGNTETSVLSNNQPMRILNSTDRSSCLESSQINLQDLSSCRANSLPTSNELQANDDNQKSLNKVGGNIVNSMPVENYSNRIPPPAHHNSVINQQPEQQQNGFLEIDRWSTLPQAKLITTAPTFIPQPQQPIQIHHATNIAATAVVTHQPQQLLVMHQPAPTVSYFPTFPVVASGHIAPIQQSQPQWNTMEINSMNIMDNSCQQNMMCVQNSINDRPQVIVPNIEEELDFLQQPEIHGGAMNSLQQAFNPDSRRNFGNDPSTGFMTSYLKFLQGGKDPSPPPSLRGKHKIFSL